jgi:hypothetical protein
MTVSLVSCDANNRNRGGDPSSSNLTKSEAIDVVQAYLFGQSRPSTAEQTLAAGKLAKYEKVVRSLMSIRIQTKVTRSWLGASRLAAGRERRTDSKKYLFGREFVAMKRSRRLHHVQGLPKVASGWRNT